MDKGRVLFFFSFSFFFGGVLTLTWLCCCCCCIGLTITAERRHCVLQAIKHHPDKHPNDPAAHDRFLEYTRAYEVLKDPDGTFAVLLCTANPCQAVQHGIACIANIYIRYFLPCSSYLLFLFSSSSFFFSLSFLFFLLTSAKEIRQAWEGRVRRGRKEWWRRRRRARWRLA